MVVLAGGPKKAIFVMARENVRGGVSPVFGLVATGFLGWNSSQEIPH